MKSNSSLEKKNFIWNTLGVTLNAFSSLFFLIIVNRINSGELGGIFSYCFSIVCLFYIISLYYNRTFQVADYNSKYSDNIYISNRLITSVLSILLIFVFALINNFSNYKLALIIVLMLYKGLESIADCFHAFIQKKEHLYFVGQSLFLKSMIGIILFLIIDIVTKNIVVSAFSLVIVNFIGLFVDIKKYKKLLNSKFKFTLNFSIDLFKETLPVFIFSFLIIFLNNCQKYISVYFMDNILQNILGIIIMPATMLALCGQYLISPYLTKLSEMYSKNKIKDFKNLVYKLIAILIILGIVILGVAYLLGIPVLNVLYSIKLDKYKISFIIIIIGAIFYAISTIVSNCLTIMQRNKEQLIVFVVSSIISIISTLIFMNLYKLQGAADAYLITMIFHCIACLSIMKYYLKKNL